MQCQYTMQRITIIPAVKIMLKHREKTKEGEELIIHVPQPFNVNCYQSYTYCWKEELVQLEMPLMNLSNFTEKVKILPVQAIPRILIATNSNYYKTLKCVLDNTAAENQENNRKLLVQLEERIRVLTEVLEESSCYCCHNIR